MTADGLPLVTLTSALLDGEPSDQTLEAAASLLPLARRNVVLVRLHERIERRGWGSSHEALRTAAAEDRLRVGRCVALIEEITALCERAGVAFVFPKAFQHYPDMGNDVDLLVAGRARDVDGVLLEGLRARRTPPGVFDRISGKTGLWRDDWAAPIEVHHGRLGQAGEQTALAAEVLANRRRVAIAGVETWVPAPDEEVLLQAYQRVCCHLFLRVADVVKGLAFVSDRARAWDPVWETARLCGIHTALGAYIEHVKRICDVVRQSSAAAGDGVAATLPPGRNAGFGVALGAVMAAYWTETRTLAMSARWAEMLRLGATPFGLAVAGCRWIPRAVAGKR